MAKNTFLRQVNTQAVTGISEKAYAAYDFTGINDSENYTDVDQYSFADANNVFVDGDDRLSTRPPLKTIVMQDFNVEDVVDVQKVDDVVFYITNDNIIHWRYNDKWREYTVSNSFDKLKIFSYDNYFLFFIVTGDVLNISGVSYNYESKEFDEYSMDDLIYIPITEIHYGATVEELTAKNLFTEKHIVEYIFNSEINTPSSAIEGQTVRIEIGDEEYVDIIWHQNYATELVKKQGTVRDSEELVNVKSLVQNETGIFFATVYETKEDSDGNEYEYLAYGLYSYDCLLWGKITPPETEGNDRYRKMIISDTGSTIWFYEYFIADKNEDADDTTDHESYTKLYMLYITIANVVKDYVNWTDFECPLTNGHELLGIGMTSYIASGSYDPYVQMQYGSSKFIRVLTTSSISDNLISIHSAEDGTCALIFSALLRLIGHGVNTYWLTIDDSGIPTWGGLDPGTYTLQFNVSKTELYDSDGKLVEKDWTYDDDYSGNIAQLALIICKNGELKSSDVYSSPDSTVGSELAGLKIYFQPSDTNIDCLTITCFNDYTNTSRYVTGLYATTNIITFNSDDCIPYYNCYTGSANFYCNSLCISNGYEVTENNEDSTYHSRTIRLSTDRNFINAFLNNFDEIKVSNTVVGNLYHLMYITTNTDNNGVEVSADILYQFKSTIGLKSGYDANLIGQTKLTLDLTSSSTCSSYAWMYNNGLYNEDIHEESSKIINYFDDAITISHKAMYISDHVTPTYRLITETYTYNSDTRELNYLLNLPEGEKIPVSIDGNGMFYYRIDNDVYTNNFTDDWYVYYTDDTGTDTPVMPEFIDAFITHTVVFDNLLYQANIVTLEDDNGLLYIPEDSKVVLPDTITGTVMFSQTVLALFTEHTAYEYTYDDETGYFQLYPTKLQLGNRKDYDICTAFDGLTIYLATVFGYKSLTYESFIQSTEQAFTDCCANIYNKFIEFDDAPIKQAKYNYWIFLYKEGDNNLLVYDTRQNLDDYYNPLYPKWFRWTLPCKIEKLYYDGRDCYVFTGDTVYLLDFSSIDVMELGQHIDWFIRSQKLHFNYPAYYKHVSTLTVLTSQGSDVRYKLKFTNYHNAYDTEHTDVKEYQVETVGVCVKRVNFLKINALQYEISNDDTDDNPKKFAISGINIKYRITENVR